MQPKTVSNQMYPQVKSKVRVLLVDDHPFVLEGLRSYLTSSGLCEIVGEASNGREAVERSKKLQPNVVVMDISMPIMNGLEATRHLRKNVPDAKVLIMTVHNTQEFATQIISAGARGFVPKSASPTELVRAIESINRGDTYFGANVTEAFLRDYVRKAGRRDENKTSELSLREREVLTLVAEGLTNKQAASLLGISVRTIEKHRERIMDKLNLHSVVELTKYAIAKRMIRVE